MKRTIQVTAHDEQTNSFDVVYHDEINFDDQNSVENPKTYQMPVDQFFALVGESGEPDEFVGSVYDVEV